MDTTRLDDLPVHNNATASSMGQPTGNNVVIQQYDPNMSVGPVAASGASNQQSVMDQRTLQEFVSGVQRASSAGMTALPSRDIPRDSLSMQHDEQVKPNYIPQQQHRAQDEIGSDGDYIKRYETSDDVHQNNRRSQHRLDTLEEIYTEFQMPSIRAHMLQMVPSLFNKDGNFNLIGLIVTSSSYAIAYYIISKLV